MLTSIQARIIIFSTLGTLALLLMFSICQYTWYWADDFQFINDIRTRGIIDHCINGYMKWDGRFLSLGAIIQSFNIYYLPVEWANTIWCTFFILSCYIAAKIILKELNYTITFPSLYAIVTLISIILWIGFNRHISETVYWATGGFYSVNLFMGSVWYWWLSRIREDKSNSTSNVLFILYSIVVGGSTQNLTIALLALLTIFIANDLLTNNKEKMLFLCFTIVAMAVGFIFISIAPGNSLRIQTDPEAFNLHPINLFNNYINVLLRYLTIGNILILLTVVTGFIIPFFINIHRSYNYNLVIKLPHSKKSLARFFNNIKWLIAALSTILPFILLAGFSADRTSIFFMYFLTLFIVINIAKVVKLVFPDHTNKSPHYFSNLFVFFGSYLLIIILFYSLAIKNIKQGIYLKKQIILRENFIKNSNTDIVYVHPIDTDNITFCYKFRELVKEGERLHWINRSTAEYFGVKKVELIEPTE